MKYKRNVKEWHRFIQKISEWRDGNEKPKISVVIWKYEKKKRDTI